MFSDNNADQLSSVIINPLRPPEGTVIWLHGLGADGNDFAPLVPELHLPTHLALRFVFPNAPLRPVTINNNYVMPAWYDIVSMNLNERADQKGMMESVAQLECLIKKEESMGIPPEKIVVAGFSQGAVIALATGLTFSKRLGGILALSGYLPHAEDVLAKKSAENQTTPIFLGHGTQDTVVPIFLGQASYITLEKASYNISWHTYPMPHSVCGQEIHDISTWLQKIYTS